MPHAPMLLDNTTRYECHICILVNNKRGLTPKEINKSKYHAIMHCVCISTKFYNILFSGLRGVAVTKKRAIDWLSDKKHWIPRNLWHGEWKVLAMLGDLIDQLRGWNSTGLVRMNQSALSVECLCYKRLTWKLWLIFLVLHSATLRSVSSISSKMTDWKKQNQKMYRLLNRTYSAVV